MCLHCATINCTSEYMGFEIVNLIEAEHSCVSDISVSRLQSQILDGDISSLNDNNTD